MATKRKRGRVNGESKGVHTVKAGARRLPLGVSRLVRILVVVVIVIMIAPVVIAILVPSARTVHSFVVAAKERVAIMLALGTGSRRIAVLLKVIGIHLAMRIEVAVGGLKAFMECAAAYVVVVVGRLDIPLNDLRMCVARGAHRNTHEAQENNRSNEADKTFHIFFSSRSAKELASRVG